MQHRIVGYRMGKTEPGRDLILRFDIGNIGCRIFDVFPHLGIRVTVVKTQTSIHNEVFVFDLVLDENRTVARLLFVLLIYDRCPRKELLPASQFENIETLLSAKF